MLLAIERDKAEEVIKKISLVDLLFFIALFVIVGDAEYSGLLKAISGILVSASMGNQTMYLYHSHEGHGCVYSHIECSSSYSVFHSYWFAIWMLLQRM